MEIRWGMENLHDHSLDVLACRKFLGAKTGYFFLSQPINKVSKVRIVFGHMRAPKLFNGEMPCHKRQPLEMVGVGMAQHHSIQSTNTTVPQIGRHHMPTHIKRTAIKATAIDEHCSPAREFHHSRVALSHVQIGYPEMGLWRENVGRNQP